MLLPLSGYKLVVAGGSLTRKTDKALLLFPVRSILTNKEASISYAVSNIL